MKKIIFTILTLGSIINVQSQVQIGGNIYGDAIFNSLGWSVGTSGDAQTIVIGSPGANVTGDTSGKIEVYQLNGSNWIQQGSDIDAFNVGDNAGRAVDITDDGTTIVIGVLYSNEFEQSAGLVRVFEFDGTDWIQKGSDLFGSASNHEFGTNVTISNDGNRIAVGAPYFDSSINGLDTGALKIFDFDGSQWNLSFEVEGDMQSDVFGMSLDMSGDGNHVICGAWINEDGTTREGYAKVFTFENANWSQVGSTIFGEVPGNFFGYASTISNDGNRIAIGSWANDENGTSSGEVEAFEFNGNSWEPLGLDLQGDGSFQRFGWSIDLSGDGQILAVGAPQDNYMKIYRLLNGNWIQIGNTLTGIGANDEFGWSVNLTTDGTKVVVGDPSNDEIAILSGFAQVYDISQLLSVSEFQNNEFRLFPNPTHSKLTLQSQVGMREISIVDVNGRRLQTIDNLDLSLETSINVENLSNGIYFLNIQTEKSKQVIRFIKN